MEREDEKLNERATERELNLPKKCSSSISCTGKASVLRDIINTESVINLGAGKSRKN